MYIQMATHLCLSFKFIQIHVTSLNTNFLKAFHRFLLVFILKKITEMKIKCYIKVHDKYSITLIFIFLHQVEIFHNCLNLINTMLLFFCKYYQFGQKKIPLLYRFTN